MGNAAVRADGVGMAETITLMVTLDGADTSMTCTVVGPASSCTLPGALNLPARSLVGVRVVASGLGALTVGVSWSWTFS